MIDLHKMCEMYNEWKMEKLAYLIIFIYISLFFLLYCFI